jgi:YggT family protein
MGSSFGEAALLIISKLGGIYLAAVMLRFLLQAARADFYNPVCQVIVKITSPLVNPLRRVIPGWRRLDIATLILALVLNTLATYGMVLLTGQQLQVGMAVSWAFVGLLAFTLDLYFYAMVVLVVASFIAPFSGHPVLLLIFQLLQPFYKLAQRIIPPMGGLDFTPLLLMLAIQVIEILVLNPLASGLRVVPAYVIGL